MSPSKISLQARATGPGLALRITLDQQEVYYSVDLPEQAQYITCDFADDDDTDHELIIELLHKTTEHTEVDEQGNILADTCVEISDVALDDIQLGQVFVEQAEYHHDFNGTQDPIVEKFYGTMGCNGTVRLKFSSPVYIWLLENM